LNALQSGVSRWIREIQKVRRSLWSKWHLRSCHFWPNSALVLVPGIWLIQCCIHSLWNVRLGESGKRSLGFLQMGN
jgi:hypothetical protein